MLGILQRSLHGFPTGHEGGRICQATASDADRARQSNLSTAAPAGPIVSQPGATDACRAAARESRDVDRERGERPGVLFAPGLWQASERDARSDGLDVSADVRRAAHAGAVSADARDSVSRSATAI